MKILGKILEKNTLNYFTQDEKQFIVVWKDYINRYSFNYNIIKTHNFIINDFSNSKISDTNNKIDRMLCFFTCSKCKMLLVVNAGEFYDHIDVSDNSKSMKILSCEEKIVKNIIE